MKELALFRRLAVFGIHDSEFVLFRCVDGNYRVYDKEDLVVLFEIDEETAYNNFYRDRRYEARFTFLDSPFRKRAA